LNAVDDPVGKVGHVTGDERNGMDGGKAVHSRCHRVAPERSSVEADRHVKSLKLSVNFHIAVFMHAHMPLAGNHKADYMRMIVILLDGLEGSIRIVKGQAQHSDEAAILTEDSLGEPFVIRHH